MKKQIRDFPGSPVIKTLHSGGTGSIPGWGTKIPHATQRGQKNPKHNKKSKSEKTIYTKIPFL